MQEEKQLLLTMKDIKQPLSEVETTKVEEIEAKYMMEGEIKAMLKDLTEEQISMMSNEAKEIAQRMQRNSHAHLSSEKPMEDDETERTSINQRRQRQQNKPPKTEDQARSLTTDTGEDNTLDKIINATRYE
ncbi:hypothetical protein BsWGS_28758 [Bradybaena similaris]